MPVVDGSLGSLVQGVSQQPARARRPGQSEEQLNIRNDEVFGLSRRSPTKFSGSVAGITQLSHWDDAEYGFLTLEDGSLVTWFARNGSITIVDTDGSTIDTVAHSYLPADALGKIVVASVGDQFLVLNKDTVPAMNTAVSADYADTLGAVIYARGGQSACEFAITVIDDTMTIRAVTETSSTDVSQITTTYIIDTLYDMLTGATAELTAPELAHLAANYTFDKTSDHMLILANSASTNSRVVCTDGSGQTLLIAVNEDVSEVGRLPVRARKNQLVRVQGDDAIEDDYYLRFDTDSTSATGTFENIEGTWTEDAARDTNFRIDASTMPHVLEASGGSWTLSEQTWTDKFAGDDDSNPDPAFIGEPIQDLLEFQERLAFLHGRQVSLSQSQETTNFFLQSATGVQDDDTVNVEPTSGRKINTLRYGELADRDLIIYADNDAQFTISGRSKLVPATASIPLTAEFGMNTAIRPAAAGNVVFYGTTVGSHTEVSEMYLLGQDESHERRSVSNHVPRYIPGAVDSLVADDGNNMVLVWERGTKDVYLYEYLWQDNKRLQSAWSPWEFLDDVMAIHIAGSTMTLLMRQDANLPAYIATMDLARNATAGLDVEVHLDRLQTASGPTVTLPTLPDGYEYLSVDAGSGTNPGLRSSIVESVDNGTTKDYTVTGDVILGVAYTSRLVPTMPVIKDAQGVARSKSDLAVSKFLIAVKATGPFNIIRQTQYEDAEDYWEMNWEGRTWDDPDLVLGSVPIDDALIEFAFEDNAATSRIVIETDAHLPMNIVEIEWEGSIRGRSTRVNTGG